MADIRIKDLTTTASSSASDDFIAIDGTTNGTRKLNAFSPTFGGNATVTGTLTANSTATIAGRVISNASSTATDAAGFAHVTGYSSGGKTYTGFSAGGIAVNQSAAFGYVYDSGTPANSFAHITPYGSTEGSLFKFSPAGVLTLGATTASTTTSSGALVVSGGVGVGGAVTAGGTLRVVGSSQIIRVRHDASNIEFTNTAQDAYVTGTVIGNTLQLSGNNGNGILIGATGIATVQATTPSTSTSNGALVVNGGVGVAGAVNAGTFYGLVDGVTAPATESGYARIYVDSADGDLKVKFGDGTVKTIATDS